MGSKVKDLLHSGVKYYFVRSVKFNGLTMQKMMSEIKGKNVVYHEVHDTFEFTNLAGERQLLKATDETATITQLGVRTDVFRECPRIFQAVFFSSILSRCSSKFIAARVHRTQPPGSC